MKLHFASQNQEENPLGSPEARILLRKTRRIKKMKKQQETQSRKTKESILCYVIVGIMAVSCFLPLWIAFVASISDETAIVSYGFSLLPRKPTLGNLPVYYGK